jgi:hypothetical protein
MIHSVLRDWDVEDSKKDRKMKAWETEKECTYVCWEFFFIFSPNLKQILNLTRLSKKF